jgi:hypothetical protein
MKMQSEIVKLLAKDKHNSLAKQLLQDFPDNQGFDATGPVAIQAARQIFCQRAKHNERIGDPIKGFRDLVTGLEAFKGNTVVIYTVHFDEGDYRIFADADMTEIAGVLKFPKPDTAQEILARVSELQAV